MFMALIGDINGKIIGEIQANISEVIWRINEIGQVSFTLPATSRYLTNDFIKYGNTLLLRFSNGLPNWGGIIDPPLQGGQTAVSLIAYSGESLLGLRTTAASRYFSSANVGYIFRKVIEEANDVRDTGLQVETPSFASGAHSPDYHYTSLLDVVKSSIIGKLSSSEFRVVASEEAGYIRFTAEIYERLGYYRQGIALVEGKNAASIESYEEQGPIINKHTVIGSGNTWGSSRPKGTAVDEVSQYLYRLRETSEIHSDTASPSTLKASAENLSRKYSRPRRVMTVTLVDAPPAPFATYDIGDTLRASFYSAGIGGFESTVRVISRAFNPVSNSCKAVLEEDLS